MLGLRLQQLMDSAALVHIPPVRSPCKKTKTALNIILGEEGDDDPCDDCEEQYFMEKVVPRRINPL